jgi:hypothetical protein
MNLSRVLSVAVPALAFASPAHAHFGTEVYLVPVSSFLFGIAIGAFTLPGLSRISKAIMLVVAFGALLGWLVPMALSQVPGTHGVRVAFSWLLVFAAFLYVPFQVGRLGMSALVAGIRSLIARAGDQGHRRSGAP